MTTTTAKPAKQTLHQKLAEVFVAVERVPKNGTAPSVMGGYKFVQVGDAAEVIRKELSARNLTMMPVQQELVSTLQSTTKSGAAMTTGIVRTTFHIEDGDSGEFIEIQSLGAGADSGDKFISKALTSSMKYALLVGFLLPTGDDIEAHTLEDRLPVGASAPTVDRSAGRHATDAQKRMFFAEAGKAGIKGDEVKHFVSIYSGKTSTKDLLFSDIDVLLAALKDPAKTASVGEDPA